MQATSPPVPSAADRIPPHNLEAEQAVLGSMFLAQDACSQVIEVLDAEDFYRPAHAKAYAAMRRLHERGDPVDIISVADELGDELESIGGSPYLLTVTNCVPTSANALHHAGLVKKAATRRSLVVAGTRIATLGYEEDDVDEALASAREMVVGIRDTGKRRAVTLKEARDARLEDYRKPTPYYCLPGSSVRLHFGDLAIIAGLPAKGKTALALWAAAQWAYTQRTSFFTYEMTQDELVDRIIAAKTKFSTEYAFAGLSDSEVDLYREATDDLPDKFYIKECAGISVRQLVSSMRMFAAGGGRIAVLDYLQKAVPREKQDINNATAYLTGELAAFGKSSGCAVLALSQYNRNAAYEISAKGKLVFPKLKDLRDSGAIEQDAAFVGLMAEIPGMDAEPEYRKAGIEYRELMKSWNYDVKDEDPRRLLRIEWAKVRHGQRRVEFFHFDGQTMTFEPLLKLVDGTWADLGLEE